MYFLKKVHYDGVRHCNTLDEVLSLPLWLKKEENFKIKKTLNYLKSSATKTLARWHVKGRNLIKA